MENVYDRLGSILRDKLDSDEDPFDAWDPHAGRTRQAGNARERTPPPRRQSASDRESPRERPLVRVPDELKEDFRVLGLPPGVPLAECKSAWKKLLKTHHPDYQTADLAAQTRSNVLSARITDAWRRISHWYETGKTV
jgi:DnaJ-domain-containing protein 1